MFIKVKIADDKEVMLNSDIIACVKPFIRPDPDTGEDVYECYVDFIGGGILEVCQPFNQLEYILQANSIEKEIDRLKRENAQTAMRMQYDEIYSTLYGGKRE